MKKFLSIDASVEVIKYWRDKGYEIIFVFSPAAEKVVRPEMGKTVMFGYLDPRLAGSW